MPSKKNNHNREEESRVRNKKKKVKKKENQNAKLTLNKKPNFYFGKSFSTEIFFSSSFDISYLAYAYLYFYLLEVINK